MCIGDAWETGWTCGGIKTMESIWPEKQIRANLPFMAHMLYEQGEVGFKADDKFNDFAEPPSGASSHNHRAALPTRTLLPTATLCRARPLRASSRRPGSQPRASDNDSRARRLPRRTTARSEE